MSGVTEGGFVVKTELELFDELGAEGRATIDDALDVSPDSVFGQLAGIVASKHAELWEVLEAVWGALSESASGQSLDRVAALTGTTRLANESDAALRIRRRLELADQGATTVSALHAALSKLTGVIAARAVSNRSMVTDADGRPPKSVEAVVLGGTQAEIAQTVWDNLPMGIEAYGTGPTAAVTVTDDEGNSQVVGYSVAEPANYHVRVSAEIDEGSYPGSATLKEVLRDFTSGALTLEMSNGTSIAGGVDIGGTLYRSRISAAALTVPGVIGVTRVEFSVDGTAWQDVDLDLPARSYLGKEADVEGPLQRGFVAEHIQVVTT
jgi:hypothetical protein